MLRSLMNIYACIHMHVHVSISTKKQVHTHIYTDDNFIMIMLFNFFFISFQVMLKWHRESTRNLFWIISQLSNWVTLPSILLETKIWKSNQIFLTTIILDYKKILLKPQFFNMRM